MYHYVRPVKESKYPHIKGLELDGFIRQIRYFKDNFNFITAKQLLDSIYDNIPIPKNAILLTFDDGFKDHYLHVFPMLKKFEIQGLFFPPAKAIEECQVLDVHKIHFILASCDNKQKLIDKIFHLINMHKDEYDLDAPESYFAKLAIPNRFDTKEVIFIKRILQRELPNKLRGEIIYSLFKEFVTSDQKSFSKELYLSFEEIEQMKQSGMYFGSHGYSHEWLTYLSSNELKLEIENSLNFYYKINQEKTDMIMCYPYGDYNNSVIQELKAHGFRAGFTTEIGDANLSISNAFLLKRYDANDFMQ